MLHPDTGGKSRHFGFTFGELSYHLFLGKVYGADTEGDWHKNSVNSQTFAARQCTVIWLAAVMAIKINIVAVTTATCII